METTVEHAAHRTGDFASAIGRGLIAGLIGTAAITASQMIEMQITGRKKSQAPAEVVEEVLDILPETPADEERLSQLTHWAYGSSWGVLRGMLDEAGIHGWGANALHFGAVFGTALVMLPSMNLAKPVTEHSPKQLAVEALHHAIYAAVVGLVYEAISPDGEEKA